MAIDTNNEKLALMEWDNVWEPALPLSPGTFAQDDKQQLLWGYPGIVWGSAVTILASVTLLGSFIHAISLKGSFIRAISLTGRFIRAISLKGKTGE